MVKDTDLLEKIRAITLNTDVQMELHRNAMLTKEYIEGNQWIFMDRLNNIQNVPYDERYYHDHRRYRPRETVNIIFPIYRTYKAYLTKTRPQISTSPENPEDVYDILGARVAQRLMEYLYESLVIRRRSDKIFNYMLIYGTAILHPFYNTELETCDLKVIPPTQIFVYPEGETEWENVRGVCWQRTVPTELLKRDYPKIDFSSTVRESHLEPIDYNHRSSGEEKTTTLNDYCELPDKNGNGLWIRAIQNQVLEQKDKFSFENKNSQGRYQIPYIPIFDNRMPDELFGFSTLNKARARQDTYNKGKSLFALLREQIPKLLIDQGTRLKINDVIDDTSTVLEYNGQYGDKPSYTAPPQLNFPLIQDVISIPSEVEHELGFHGVTLRAETIGSVQSGIGIQSLQQQDEIRLAPTLESIRIGMIKTFEQLYALVRFHYTTKQKKQILGEMGEIDIAMFEDIKLSPMTFTIQEATFTPFSQMARQQIITQLLPTGILNAQDPRSRRQILKYIDPNLASDFDPMVMDERQQRVENIEMLKGNEVNVHPDDEDGIHLDEINKIVKDIRFKDLKPVNGIDRRALFLKHKADHQIAQKKKELTKIKEMMMIKQAVQQQIQGGMNPGGGRPNQTGSSPNLEIPQSPSGLMPPEQNNMGGF